MYWGNKIIIYVNNFKTTQVKNIFHFKGERKKFLKNCSLTACAIIFGQISFFSIIKRFLEENVSLFILSQRYFQRSSII